jgi:hypothetical protein
MGEGKCPKKKLMENPDAICSKKVIIFVAFVTHIVLSLSLSLSIRA